MLWLCIQLCLHNGSWWRRVRPHSSNYGSGVRPIFHPPPRIPAILFLHHESTSYLENVVLPKIAPAAVRRRHHCLPSLANLMIGWQMCKRASKESHKLQSCACSHCAWNTVCIVHTYDIGINCPSGGIGFEHLDRRNIFLHPLSARYLPIAKLSLPSLKVMKVQVHRPFRFHAGYSTHNWDHHCNCQLENVFTGSSIPLQSRNLFLTLE